MPRTIRRRVLSQQLRPVFCTAFALLLLLDDPLADIPISFQHHGVDGGIGIQTGILYQTFDVVDKSAF